MRRNKENVVANLNHIGDARIRLRVTDINNDTSILKVMTIEEADYFATRFLETLTSARREGERQRNG